jgi:hypothetical protein
MAVDKLAPFVQGPHNDPTWWRGLWKHLLEGHLRVPWELLDNDLRLRTTVRAANANSMTE